MDLPLSREKFTWCSNKIKPTFCRLDRFLLLTKFVVKMSRLMQKVLSRSLSDHNPIYLTVNMVNWGPKPFRFFNHWLDALQQIYVLVTLKIMSLKVKFTLPFEFYDKTIDVTTFVTLTPSLKVKSDDIILSSSIINNR